MTILPYDQAQAAVRAQGIRSARDYAARYQEIPGLPPFPALAYAAHWQSWGRFLSRVLTRYLTYAEASAAAIAAEWLTARAYRAGYHTVAGLPSKPDRMYADEWTDWQTFLGDRRL